MSDYDDDFEAADSPAKDATTEGSWLRPLNRRPTSPGSDDSHHQSTDGSIPPTPSSHRSSHATPPATPPGRRSRESTPVEPVSDDYSDGDDDAPAAAAPAWSSVKPPAKGNTATEIAELRRRNAELQAAVDAVKQQLANVGPKLDAHTKRKHNAENERMNKLQEEATALRNEHARLKAKLKDADQVAALEKQLADRQTELKTLNDRNKLLQMEIRNNAKKLKQMATIEEQRAKMLSALKQELKVAQNAVAKAERDAELAIQARDGAAQRLKALELKDKVPELKPEDVRHLIEMKNALTAKQETIEALQYRLSVLKRAHESAQKSLVADPTDTNEVEALRAEVAVLRSKLAVGKAQPDRKTSAEAPTSKQPPQNAAAVEKEEAPAAQPAASEAVAPAEKRTVSATSSTISSPSASHVSEPAAPEKETPREPAPAQAPVAETAKGHESPPAASTPVASTPVNDTADEPVDGRDSPKATSDVDSPSVQSDEPDWLDD